MPASVSSSGERCACVIDAGCSIRVSVQPRLTARFATWSASMKRRPASVPPRMPNAIIAPKPFICFFATSWPGSLGSPG